MNAARPSTEPTDRSTLRVISTSVWPAARIAKIDALSARLRSEAASRKRGSRIAVTTISSASATTMPSSRTRKTHSVRRRARAPSTGGRGRRSRRGLARRWPGRRPDRPLLVGLVAAQLRGQPALVHHQHAVGHAEHLGQLGRDHQHRDARARPARSAAGGPRPWCRRRCRASARRRSAPSARSRATWPARPSAGCRRRASPTGSSSRWYLSWSLRAPTRAASAFSAAERIRPPRDSAPMPGQRRVARDREVHHEALLAAVLGHEPDAGAHRGARACRPAAAGRRPRRGRRPRGRCRRSRGRPRCGPAPTSPASATISPARTSKRTSKNTPSRVSRSTFSTGAPTVVSCLGNSALELAADHPAHDLVGRHVGDPRVVHDRAVAHDGDGVADREDLLEAVRDEQHRGALLAQRAHDAEQPLDLGAGERGGRLVHDQHARVEAQRLGDLDDLLVGDREAADRAARGRAGRRAGRAAPGPRVCIARRSIRLQRAERVVAHDDVLRDAEVGEQRRLLVDHGDAGVARVVRGVEVDRLAVDEHLARVAAGRRRRAPSRASTCRRRSRPSSARTSPRAEREVAVPQGAHRAVGLASRPQSDDRRRQDQQCRLLVDLRLLPLETTGPDQNRAIRVVSRANGDSL